MTSSPLSYSAATDGVAMSTLDASRLEKGEVVEAEWKPGKKEYLLMFTIAVISLMVALDATILVSVLPTLAVDLGGSATDAFWAGTSYLLACAVCQPFIAALSDIFGRKEMLITSVLFFTMGTALCAPIAKTFAVFFVGRAVQGIGGGGIISMGQVIFADIVPLRQRPKYFSIVLAAWALGSVLGPLIGGLFVEHVFWAWCFYLNFPFCVLGLVLIPIYVKLTTPKTSLASKLARVDWVGSVLFTASTTSFLVGISWGGIQFSWSSVQVIAPLACGVAGIVFTIFWESSFAREPILRPSLFHSSSAIITYACALFQGLILFCVLYYVPFYFTAVKFVTPTQAGLDVFPVTCLLLPGSIVVSIVVSRIGRFRWALWAGWMISAVGCGLFELFNEDTSIPVWAVVLAVFGIGQGMLLTSINVGIQAISRVEDAGRAAAMYAFMRTLGMSIGVAIGGTAFQNVMAKELRRLGLPEEIAHDAEAFVSQMRDMEPTNPIRIGALQAYIKGFHGVYWIITASAVFSFLLSLGVRRHSMDKILLTKFVLRGGRPTEDLATVTMTTHTLGTSQTSLPQSPKMTIEREGREKQESQVTLPSAHAVEDAAAVAYYVEPGGKVTPVDIRSTPEPEEKEVYVAYPPEIVISSPSPPESEPKTSGRVDRNEGEFVEIELEAPYEWTDPDSLRDSEVSDEPFTPYGADVVRPGSAGPERVSYLVDDDPYGRAGRRSWS
ncbi:hypothetical protein OQA88_8050 [Cercophora sp. LCS_1]